MNNQDMKFTVIIPTRERADTLQWSLKTCVAQDYDNLEIIVSDNFSQDNTIEVVKSFHDKRINYINTGKRISMTSNWEFALSKVSEGWVLILGDDDGLLPSIFNKVSHIIRTTNVQAIRSKACGYQWPSLLERSFGCLDVPLASGCEIRDSKKWLSRVMDGHFGYSELPVLYHGGLVDIKVLKRIKKITGSFYKSSIPDVYSSVAIASMLDRYVYSHEPFVISGSSVNSTGASSFSNGGDKKMIEKFQSENNIPFHSDIPLCSDGNYPSSLEVITYESYLQSSPLRKDYDDSHITHAKQLEVILATVRKQHRDALKIWGSSFAIMHGLDFDLILERANRKRTLFTLNLAKRKISTLINTCTVNSPESPLRNVYEASILAGSIRKSNPKSIDNIRSTIASSIDSIRRYYM